MFQQGTWAADRVTISLDGVGQPVEAPGYFYYRRTFAAPKVLPGFALLKIHKAKYGTAVWLNGKPLGEHWPSFTPSFWDLIRGDYTLIAELTDRKETIQSLRGFEVTKSARRTSAP